MFSVNLTYVSGDCAGADWNQGFVSSINAVLEMVPGMSKFELVYCVNYNGILSYGNAPNLYKPAPA